MGQIVGGLLLLALYCVLCYLAVVWVVAPVWPFMVVGGAVLGVLAAGGVVLATLLQFGRFAAPRVTPDDVAHRLRRTRSLFPRDDAWPHYLAAQAATDLRAAAGGVSGLVSAMWTRWSAPVRKEPGALVFWPLLFLPFLAMVTGSATALVTAVVLVAALVAALLPIALGALVAAGTLRGVDRGLRVLRRARATCPDPKCTHRSRMPAYRCACGRLHRDVRAGLQGLFARRCACGAVLPTTVVGATGLVAVCQFCGRDLHAGAGALTDVVIPVFGSTSAGKTRLIYAAAVALARHLPAVGGSFRPDGADSEVLFRTATDVVEQGTQTAKTPTERPASITARIRTGASGGRASGIRAVNSRAALVHVFDAAGESFTSQDSAADLRFLDDPQGLVFVLDPFSVREVATTLRGALVSRLEAAEPAHVDPEQSYLVTVTSLRNQGVRLARLPLAVAVVKADMLLGLPPADGLTPDSTSDDVERWLRAQGLDNLLDGMSRDFREVGHHLVASWDAASAADGTAGPLSAARPLLWLLQRTNVEVPDRRPVGATS